METHSGSWLFLTMILGSVAAQTLTVGEELMRALVSRQEADDSVVLTDYITNVSLYQYQEVGIPTSNKDYTGGQSPIIIIEEEPDMFFTYKVKKLKKLVKRKEKKYNKKKLDLTSTLVPDITDSDSGQRRKKRYADKKYLSQGHNPDMLMTYLKDMLYSYTPRQGRLRDGSATDKASCSKVRPVPDFLRDPEYFYLPVVDFYTKYTEVYGIPILGSRNVSDEGLTRACYSVKHLFASRYDMRNFYYKLYGRFVLIGDDEQQNSLPEYQYLDDSYNSRVRGLGPSLYVPLTSAGDDNMKCKYNDRYYDQDILIHEGGHAAHLLSAVYSIPGFNFRLKQAYQDAMAENKYRHPQTNAPYYAATNPVEYLGVIYQMYHGCYQGPGYDFPNYGPNGTSLELEDRATVDIYDPAVRKVVDEMTPCDNDLIDRCHWKDCNLDNFELILDTSWFAKSACPIIDVSYSAVTAEDCARFTCSRLGNAFNFKKKRCQAVKCNDTVSDLYTQLDIIQGYGKFNVYKAYLVPQQDNIAEKKQPIQRHCVKRQPKVKTSPDNFEDLRCSNLEEYIPCGPTPNKDSKRTCQRRGCCWTKETGCFYPEQSCADRNPFCPLFAEKYVDGVNECDRNPAMMLRICPNSCNACDYAYRVHQVEKVAKKMCQDRLGNVINTSNCDSAYHKYYHRLQCGHCQLPTDWRTKLNIPEYP